MAESTLRIGTRGSRLALAQANMVAAALQALGTATEIVLIKTTGDRILDRPLADAGGKGLFTKELEEALLAKTVDIAVHSMKDVPVLFPEGLGLSAILKREAVEDVFISHRAPNLLSLPLGARVGTSSVRRAAQLRRARADIQPVLLRGNVDTRLKKLDDGEMDAIILALAGLKRLGLADRVVEVLPTTAWLPSLAQGAVGIEIREDDDRAREAITPLNHAQTAAELTCERAFQAILDGSCRTPIAGLARMSGTGMCFRGEVLAPDGSDYAAGAFSLEFGLCGNDSIIRSARECGAALKPQAAAWLAI